jgi:hypothetical protein
MASRKGIPNKSTLLRKWIGTDKDPAMFMLKLMMDPAADVGHRLDCAKTLIPYVHRKQPVEVEQTNESSGVFEFRIVRAADSLAGHTIAGTQLPQSVQCAAGAPEIRQDSPGYCRVDLESL